MKDSRILLHYIRRLSSSSTGHQHGNYFRRLSALRAQIQKQSRLYQVAGIPNFFDSALKQRLAQWPLGLSYYNKLAALPSSHLNVFANPWPAGQSPGTGDNYLCSSSSKGLGDGDFDMEKQRERFHKAKRRLREKKENIMEEMKEAKDQMRQKMDEIITKENIYTVPNLLCVLRIGAAPILGYMIVNQQYGPAIGIFAFAGVTDLLDGYIARTVPGQSSVLGSFLDPLADKILVATLFLTLTYANLIPVPLTALIVARDSCLMSAGFYIRYKSLSPPRTLSRYFDVSHPSAQLAPTYLSKVNTGIQLGLVGATLISTVLPYDLSTFLSAVCWCTATTTIGSGVSYLFARDTFKLVGRQSGQDKDADEGEKKDKPT